jgi:hypothetical protein
MSKSISSEPISGEAENQKIQVVRNHAITKENAKTVVVAVNSEAPNGSKVDYKEAFWSCCKAILDTTGKILKDAAKNALEAELKTALDKTSMTSDQKKLLSGTITTAADVGLNATEGVVHNGVKTFYVTAADAAFAHLNSQIDTIGSNVDTSANE